MANARASLRRWERTVVDRLVRLRCAIRAYCRCLDPHRRDRLLTRWRRQDCGSASTSKSRPSACRVDGQPDRSTSEAWTQSAPVKGWHGRPGNVSSHVNASRADYRAGDIAGVWHPRRPTSLRFARSASLSCVRKTLGDATDRRCFEPARRPLSARVCARSPACLPARQAASTSRVIRADRPTVFASDRTDSPTLAVATMSGREDGASTSGFDGGGWCDPGDPRHRFDASPRQSGVIAWATRRTRMVRAPAFHRTIASA